MRPVQELNPGFENETRFVPLDEATLIETLFDVGNNIKFKAKYTGQLICFANDAHNLYWNNAGYINVTVTRVSWPPKPPTEETYQNLYLPACDSAIAVYSNNGKIGTNKAKCNSKDMGSGWKL